jgi:methylmalonyl-CoA mutase N-terminal domain/subunit
MSTTADPEFTTLSGEPIRPPYTEADLPSELHESIGLPGEFPFTRGEYESMYRGRLWTMRQFAGFGTAEETNTPLLLDAARAHASEGEIIARLQRVWGSYRETPAF